MCDRYHSDRSKKLIMIRYIHFAFDNLYLLNGYKEINYGDDIIYEYEHLDELEQCIRCLVASKKESLKGWDLRFLRRGLEITQAEFGETIGRDGQTVARWEKQQEVIPKFADLAIRLIFSGKFTPSMTAKELLQINNGSGNKYPEKIFLKLVNNNWHLESGFRKQVASSSTVENFYDIDFPSQFSESHAVLAKYFTQQFLSRISSNDWVSYKGTHTSLTDFKAVTSALSEIHGELHLQTSPTTSVAVYHSGVTRRDH